MEWLATALNWVLGLVTLAVVGIIAMYARVEVLLQRLISHEKWCAELHGFHRQNIKDIWVEIDDLKKRRLKE